MAVSQVAKVVAPKKAKLAEAQASYEEVMVGLTAKQQELQVRFQRHNNTHHQHQHHTLLITESKQSDPCGALHCQVIASSWTVTVYMCSACMISLHFAWT